ncbi:MAG: hypothetical protein JWL83_2299 [Actinomycetia bacterium]|nr:hypothetical protein [Actinomycetes bacterium]
MRVSCFGKIAAVAARSLGLVTRAQAARLGVSDAALRHMVDGGILEQCSRHVFRVTAAPRTPGQPVLAACLAAGPDALAARRTAAALHRFDGCAPLERVTPIEIVVPATCRVRAADYVLHRSDTLEAIDRCWVGPIPATSRVRTLIDLGAVVSREQVEEALDGAERDGKVDRRILTRRVAALRAPGRSGVGTIAAILDRRAAIAALPRSVLERRFTRLVHRHRLPVPVAQHRVVRTDGKVAYLDFAYPDRHLAIELQGNGTHATPGQRAADHTRANALPAWRFVWFTYEDVLTRPDYVAATIAHRL